MNKIQKMRGNMVSIQTSVQLQDRMTATLNQITQAMAHMVNFCESAQGGNGARGQRSSMGCGATRYQL